MTTTTPETSTTTFLTWAEGPNPRDLDDQTVEALNHEEAAERWAEQSDQYDEHRIASGRYTPIVVVQGPRGDVRRFKVSGRSGEAIPSYSVELLEDEEPAA